MSEEELVDKILRSTSEGMTIAIDLYGGAVKKICMSILAGYQNEDVEEAVSDSFVALWKAIETGRYDRSVGIKYYLYGIARRTALNKKRELAKNQTTEDIDNVVRIADVDVEQEAMRKVEYQILNEMIMELGSPDKEIFLYRYYEQFTIKEIAAKLMITVKTVENKLTRGRARLKKKLLQCGVSL
ncbi:MAG: sigma-70 family RNA polymerase sigma factor [Lachnospiraceae bacterium]|nr:sigma-70 family RNA polymerase sigma factor [Lachnospiraceae bacterium]